METRITCPLGSECERAVDGVLERCRWYTKVTGKHPQSHEEVDRWDCAIAWLPLLTIEMSRTNRGQTQALESLRNIVHKGNEAARLNLERNAVLPSQ